MWQLLHHETRLKLKRIKVIESMFFKHTRVKLETTTAKKKKKTRLGILQIFGNAAQFKTYIWKNNNRKIRKYFELNGNKINTYNISPNFKKRRKIFIQKNKLNILKIAKKTSRRNEIINIWEFRRSLNKTDKNKRWFWKNIKIDNFLTNQNKREDKIRKFRNPLVINRN